MEKLTNEEKAKIMALPLIELKGDDIKNTDSVMKGIKDVFATTGLPLIDELVITAAIIHSNICSYMI